MDFCIKILYCFLKRRINTMAQQENTEEQKTSNDDLLEKKVSKNLTRNS